MAAEQPAEVSVSVALDYASAVVMELVRRRLAGATLPIVPTALRLDELALSGTALLLPGGVPLPQGRVSVVGANGAAANAPRWLSADLIFWAEPARLNSLLGEVLAANNLPATVEAPRLDGLSVAGELTLAAASGAAPTAVAAWVSNQAGGPFAVTEYGLPSAEGVDVVAVAGEVALGRLLNLALATVIVPQLNEELPAINEQLPLGGAARIERIVSVGTALEAEEIAVSADLLVRLLGFQTRLRLGARLTARIEAGRPQFKVERVTFATEPALPLLSSAINALVRVLRESVEGVLNRQADLFLHERLPALLRESLPAPLDTYRYTITSAYARGPRWFAFISIER